MPNNVDGITPNNSESDTVSRARYAGKRLRYGPPRRRTNALIRPRARSQGEQTCPRFFARMRVIAPTGAARAFAPPYGATRTGAVGLRWAAILRVHQGAGCGLRLPALLFFAFRELVSSISAFLLAGYSWQREIEGCALIHNAFSPGSSTVSLNYAPYVGQADAGAFKFGGSM